MSAATSLASEVSELQERMAQIRLEMHEDVQGAVKRARSLADWRGLVRRHPALTLGTAAAVGYLLVPWRAARQQPVVSSVPAPQAALVAAAAEQPDEAPPARSKAAAAVWDAVMPVVVRAAQNYALHQFEQWLAAHPAHPPRRAQDTGPAEATPQPVGEGYQGGRVPVPR